MKRTPWLFGSLTAALIAGCGGDRRNTDTGTTGGAESGTMQGGAGTATDTAMRSTDTTGIQPGATGGMSSDTARTGSRMHNDSAKGNQTKSGVTDTRTGKSTLGEGVTQTRPDQGQPVTSKGDTVRSGGDSVPSPNQ
jgi:hypothetical protein